MRMQLKEGQSFTTQLKDVKDFLIAVPYQMNRDSVKKELVYFVALYLDVIKLQSNIVLEMIEVFVADATNGDDSWKVYFSDEVLEQPGIGPDIQMLNHFLNSRTITRIENTTTDEETGQDTTSVSYSAGDLVFGNTWELTP